VKKQFVLAATLTLLTFAAAVASAEFEGVASFKITMNAGPNKPAPASGEGKIYLGPAGYRVEWSMDLSAMWKGRGDTRDKAPKMTMTMLTRKAEPGKAYMLNAEKKTYSIVDAAKSAQRATSKEAFTVKKLGADTVAGLPCQNVLLSSSNGAEIEVCVAKDFPASSDWLSSLTSRQSQGSGWLAALKTQGIEGFPVRWVIRKKGSTQPLTTMEITSIEKKSVPASLFEIPAGYTETQFAMGGLTPEQRKAFDETRQRYKPTPKP
jgi:Domain of unknown function (DUF4412)